MGGRHREGQQLLSLGREISREKDQGEKGGTAFTRAVK